MAAWTLSATLLGLTSHAAAESLAGLFCEKFLEQEARLLERVRGQESRRARTLERQPGVALAALEDVLMERIGPKDIERSAGRLSRDGASRPELLSVAAVAGVVTWYFNGLRARSRLGGFSLGMVLYPGRGLHEGAAAEAPGPRVAGLELGYKGRPVTLAVEWGLAAGGLRGDRIDLRYSKRF